MRASLLLFLLILLLGSVAQLWLPPWSLALAAFGLAFALGRRVGAPFRAGFGAGLLSWLLPALVLNARNAGLLAHRVAQLLPLGGRPAALLAITALVGGLLAGLAAWAGARSRAAV